MLKLASAALIVLAWWVVSLLMPKNLFPGPLETSTVLWANLLDGEIGLHLSITLLRVAGGFALAMLIGIPVGVVMGLYRRAERVLSWGTGEATPISGPSSRISGRLRALRD